ncbi:transcriptional regulator, TetR family [Desulfatibacillum alkenivorans DSM 16219]|jgi:AcrR family transcriptional regulator|uniref:Transcriptional regulator, TetR family n=1 Tax=Desulfatibacillum alkenivorans DSM 16219 TaxID=1121393 RepID=A0A1M6LTV2_9BACT|nr:TetR/AcrR family transcriptional regulator [Desulfatibacillum alkenivorans]SHJ74688.1 transcriptional regulator, TetR family [Desulfatibacillum alkenivorans DSM 16219]
MPKSTFNNLPLEKRERILRVAAELFAQTGYTKTDVALIAREAGVAKGSMYNYFESKDDIYVHVCARALEQSRTAVYGGIDKSWDIYRQIDHIFRKGSAFAVESPEFVLLYLNVSSVGMERFAEALTREVEHYTANHLRNLIRKGMEAGIVRPDINASMTAFFINSMYIVLLLSFVSRHFQIRLLEYLEIEGDMEELDREAILDQLVGMIESMLKPAAPLNDN